MMTMEAFNGYGGFERHYDTQQDTQRTEWKWPVMKSQLQLDYDKWLYANIYHPMCTSQLSKYLNKVKNRVMGKGNRCLTLQTMINAMMSHRHVHCTPDPCPFGSKVAW